MGFPKIKDRLFFSQSKNRVFFIAKTTQNELIAQPPPSSHRKHNAVTQTRARVQMRASPSKKKNGKMK